MGETLQLAVELDVLEAKIFTRKWTKMEKVRNRIEFLLCKAENRKNQAETCWW